MHTGEAKSNGIWAKCQVSRSKKKYPIWQAHGKKWHNHFNPDRNSTKQERPRLLVYEYGELRVTLSGSHLQAIMNLADISSLIRVSLHRHPKVGADMSWKQRSEEQIRKAPFSPNPEAQKPL